MARYGQIEIFMYTQVVDETTDYRFRRIHAYSLGKSGPSARHGRKDEYCHSRQVKEESLAKPQIYDAQLIDRMIKDGKIEVSEEASTANTKALREQFRIDIGEAAALFLAKEKGSILGIDDGPGIRASKILGVPFVTAIHILTGFYEQGHIDSQSALAKLEALEKWGRYHARIIEDARARIQKER